VNWSRSYGRAATPCPLTTCSRSYPFAIAVRVVPDRQRASLCEARLEVPVDGDLRLDRPAHCLLMWEA
jgi:hypothetical protein